MPVKGLEIIIIKFSGGTKPIWRLHGLFLKRIVSTTAITAVSRKTIYIAVRNTLFTTLCTMRIHHCHLNKKFFLLFTSPPHTLLQSPHIYQLLRNPTDCGVRAVIAVRMQIVHSYLFFVSQSLGILHFIRAKRYVVSYLHFSCARSTFVAMVTPFGTIVDLMKITRLGGTCNILFCNLLTFIRLLFICMFIISIFVSFGFTIFNASTHRRYGFGLQMNKS